MTALCLILCLILVLFLLYLLAIRCRKGHPAWTTLTQYRYAHRGLHDKAHGIPENSMAAFRRAVDRGFGAELDVHLTRDGRLAVIHDDSLLRTAGVDVKASDLTADELRQYRLEGTEERIPFLEEVLPLFEGKTPLIVELKVEGNAGALSQAACDLLDQFSVEYCIESFHPQAILWLKQNRPQVCRGQLSQNFLADRAGLSWPAAFAMKNLLTGFLTAPDFIAYNLHHRERLSIKLARKVWGVREVSWTIRTPEELAACEADGCLSIFEQFVPSEVPVAAVQGR
jgi:glycerophosphoryl diester phosphodiesterase